MSSLKKFGKSDFAENGFVAERFDTDLFRLAENGEIYVQDEASQAVAIVMVEVAHGGAGVRLRAADRGRGRPGRSVSRDAGGGRPVGAPAAKPVSS